MRITPKAVASSPAASAAMSVSSSKAATASFRNVFERVSDSCVPESKVPVVAPQKEAEDRALAHASSDQEPSAKSPISSKVRSATTKPALQGKKMPAQEASSDQRSDEVKRYGTCKRTEKTETSPSVTKNNAHCLATASQGESPSIDRAASAVNQLLIPPSVADTSEGTISVFQDDAAQAEPNLVSLEGSATGNSTNVLTPSGVTANSTADTVIQSVPVAAAFPSSSISQLSSQGSASAADEVSTERQTIHSPRLGVMTSETDPLPIEVSSAVGSDDGVKPHAGEPAISATASPSQVNTDFTTLGHAAPVAGKFSPKDGSHLIRSSRAEASDTGKKVKTGNDSEGLQSSLRESQGSDQHSETASLQPPVSATKFQDLGLVQTNMLTAPPNAHPPAEQTVILAGSMHDSTGMHREANPLPEQLTNGDSTGFSGIQTARLIQTLGQTEMRVGVHSAEFGDISIRTSVSQQLMQAQISVDHSELRNTIASHIPSIQSKLGSECGVHTSIEVSQSGYSLSDNRGNSPQQEYKSSANRTASVDLPVEVATDLSYRAPPAPVEGYRLDIRA